MWLTNADKSFAYAFSAVLVNLNLLAIEFTDHQKGTIPAWLQDCKGYRFHQLTNAFQVPTEVLQFLAVTSLYLAFRHVPFHAQTEDIYARFLQVGPGLLYACRGMCVELVDEYFTLFGHR